MRIHTKFISAQIIMCYVGLECDDRGGDYEDSPHNDLHLQSYMTTCLSTHTLSHAQKKCVHNLSQNNSILSSSQFYNYILCTQLANTTELKCFKLILHISLWSGVGVVIFPSSWIHYRVHFPLHLH